MWEAGQHGIDLATALHPEGWGLRDSAWEAMSEPLGQLLRKHLLICDFLETKKSSIAEILISRKVFSRFKSLEFFHLGLLVNPQHWKLWAPKEVLPGPHWHQGKEWWVCSEKSQKLLSLRDNIHGTITILLCLRCIMSLQNWKSLHPTNISSVRFKPSHPEL